MLCRPQCPLDLQTSGGGGQGRVQWLHDAAGVADLHVGKRPRHARQRGQLLHLPPLRPLQPRHEARRLRRVSARRRPRSGLKLGGFSVLLGVLGAALAAWGLTGCAFAQLHLSELL